MSETWTPEGMSEREEGLQYFRGLAEADKATIRKLAKDAVPNKPLTPKGEEWQYEVLLYLQAMQTIRERLLRGEDISDEDEKEWELFDDIERALENSLDKEARARERKS